MLQMRCNNKATVNDIVDLRKFLIDLILDTESNVVAHLAFEVTSELLEYVEAARRRRQES